MHIKAYVYAVMQGLWGLPRKNPGAPKRHNFLPTEIVKQLHQPYLVITAENAFTRPGAEQMFQNAASEVKELQVIAEATHFDMYDLEEYVTQNLQHIERFLKANL